MVKVKKFQSPLNEDSVFGGNFKNAPGLKGTPVNNSSSNNDDSPFGALNDNDVVTVIGPDQKVYNIEAIRENTAFIYRIITKEYPGLSAFLAMLKPLYTFDVPTMATDGFHIFINPSFFVKLHNIKPYLGPTYVIMHELYHNLFAHFKREHENGGNFPNHMKCNYAQDIEINTRLEDQNPDDFRGLTEQIGGVIDWKYKGWLWEDIYPELKDDQQMQSQPSVPNGGSQQQSQGQQSQGQQGSQQQNQQGNQSSQDQQNSQGQQSQGQGSQDQQSGGQDSQGQDQSNQPDSQDSGNGQGSEGQDKNPSHQPNGEKITEGTTGENVQGRFSDVLSKEEGKKIAKRAGRPYTDEMNNSDPKQIWDKAINNNMGALKSIDKGTPSGQPGTGIFETIKKILERYKPTQNWKKILEKYMNDAFMEEDSKFPQKKYIGYDRYKRYDDDVEDGLREVCILFDASGSVMGTDGAHEQFVSEINEVFKRVKIQEGTIACFADGVDQNHIVKFKRRLPDDAFTVHISGGTNYTAAIEWINYHYKRNLPGCVIILSDSDITGFGGERMPVYKWMKDRMIWFIINNSSSTKENLLKNIPAGKPIIVEERDLK